MAAWTVKVRNAASLGDPSDAAKDTLTEDVSPATGDKLFGWDSTGALRQFDVGNLPTSTDTRTDIGEGGVTIVSDAVRLDFFGTYFDVTDGGAGEADLTLKDDSIGFDKLINITTARILGRTTAGSGDIEQLTGTQTTALLVDFIGDSGAGGTKGLVPAPAAGDAAALKFLKADGTWATTPADTRSNAEEGGALVVSNVAAFDFNATRFSVAASGSDALIDIDTNAIGDTFLRDSAALSVIGRSVNSTGDPADISAGTDAFVLRRSGTTLGFGLLVTASYTDDSVTFPKVEDIASQTMLGRLTAATGDIEELAEGQVYDVINRWGPHLSPAALAANANDYDPGDSEVYRISATGSTRDITGLAPTGGNTDSGIGRWVTFFNVGTIDIRFMHQNAGSTAANRMILPGGSDYTVPGGQWIRGWYDSVTLRWRMTHQ
jgi:hypothetical protein